MLYESPFANTDWSIDSFAKLQYMENVAADKTLHMDNYWSSWQLLTHGNT